MESLSDSVLGVLTWDAELTSWNSDVILPDGSRAEMSVLDEEKEGVRVIESARPYFAGLIKNYKALRQYIADDLLDVAIRNWSADAHDVPREVAHLKIEAIHIIPGLFTEVFFDDSGIFAGHVIIVRTDKEGGKVDVTIEG
ncbi:MAG: DUF2262 domain-containing protein [bacterium]